MRSCWFPAGLALLAFTCDDAQGVPDEIGSACRRQAGCAAAASEGGALSEAERECRDRLSAEYDEASSYGCSAAYADWVSCQATQRGHCPSPGSDGSGADSASASEVADPCQGAYDALRRCQGEAGRDDCVVIGFGGAGGCSISCALFSGECSPPAGAGQESSCSCQQGEKVGSTFVGQCGQEALETNARSACQ